jgi:hypothetical protein
MRKETNFKQALTPDLERALELIDKGFYLLEDNTALEHKQGGYQKISRRVTNYFNAIELK